MKRNKIIIIFSIIILMVFVVVIVKATFISNKKKEPQIIELNSENFNEYIILNVSIEDFNVENGRGVYAWYKGVAKLKASARLKKDVQINDVVINGRIELSGLCWASNSYSFILELDKNGEAEYNKQISTGEGGILYPDEPKFYTVRKPIENEFLVKDAYIQVSGSIVE